MFDGVDACPVLPYDQPPAKACGGRGGMKRGFSFSGAQDKYSMVLDGTTLRYRQDGEVGSYIMKPCPADAYMTHRKDAPANEQLCMEIARLVFHLPTAACALCRFGNGEPAYLTRRFDRTPGGNLHMEDFAALTGIPGGNSGAKYKGSYEQLAATLKQCSTAAKPDTLRLFRTVLLNYLLCNGDAHLKNFALLGDNSRSMVLAPAYDLMNTRLHVNDDDFALDCGLFADGRPATGGMASHFTEWAKAIGIPSGTAERIIQTALACQPRVEAMVQESALSRKAQKAFLLTTRVRFKNLRTGLINPHCARASAGRGQ